MLRKSKRGFWWMGSATVGRRLPEMGSQADTAGRVGHTYHQLWVRSMCLAIKSWLMIHSLDHQGDLNGLLQELLSVATIISGRIIHSSYRRTLSLGACLFLDFLSSHTCSHFTSCKLPIILRNMSPILRDLEGPKFIPLRGWTQIRCKM